MKDMFIPRLRPNTFLTLLIRATRSEFGSRPTWKQSSSGLTRSGLFTDLLHILDTSTLVSQDTLTSYMSAFLSGKRAYSDTYFPFNLPSFQAKAGMRMEEGYVGALLEMDALCQKYLNINNPFDMRLLVGGIMETILHDDTFNENIDVGGFRIVKSELSRQEKILLQPFLLDVWYLVATRHHNSVEASETYTRWTDNGSPRPITTQIGAEICKKITVSTILPEEMSADTVKQNDSVISSDEEPVIATPDNSSSETDQEQNDQKTQQEDDAYNQTFINNGLFIEHQDGNITNVPHVENLVINMGE